MTKQKKSINSKYSRKTTNFQILVKIDINLNQGFIVCNNTLMEELDCHIRESWDNLIRHLFTPNHMIGFVFVIIDIAAGQCVQREIKHKALVNTGIPEETTSY